MLEAVWAQLGLTAQAVRAAPARHVPRQHDMVTRADCGDSVAYFGDDSGAFVAERARHQCRYQTVAYR
jgi:hypothetical protein